MPLQTETEHETTKTQNCCDHMCITLGGLTAERGIIRLSGEARFGHAGLSVICTSTATDQIHTFKANSDHSDTAPATRRRHGVSDFSRNWPENLHRRCLWTSDLLQNSYVQMSFCEFPRLLERLTPALFPLLLKVQVMLAPTELCSKRQ